ACADEPIDELALIADEDRRRLVGWSSPVRALDPTLVHERFRAQAARTPDLTAGIAPDGTALSYRELDERSTQLAHRLARGLRDAIGLSAAPSRELAIEILGILESGAAYAPSSEPDTRTAWSMAELAREPVTPLARAIDPEAPAYVLRTSGSTGRPKDVRM